MVENVLSLEFQNPNLGSVNYRLHVRQIYIKIMSFPGFTQCMCAKNGEYSSILYVPNNKWVMGVICTILLPSLKKNSTFFMDLFGPQCHFSFKMCLF